MNPEEIIKTLSENFGEIHALYKEALEQQGRGCFVFLRKPETDEFEIEFSRFVPMSKLNEQYPPPESQRDESFDAMLLKCDNATNVPVFFADQSHFEIVLIKKAQV